MYISMDKPGLFGWSEDMTQEECRRREDEFWWNAALEAADGDETKAALLLPNRIADY